MALYLMRDVFIREGRGGFETERHQWGRPCEKRKAEGNYVPQAKEHQGLAVVSRREKWRDFPSEPPEGTNLVNAFISDF